MCIRDRIITNCICIFTHSYHLNFRSLKNGSNFHDPPPLLIDCWIRLKETGSLKDMGGRIKKKHYKCNIYCVYTRLTETVKIHVGAELKIIYMLHNCDMELD